jgi:WD40 repeat protein
VGVAKVHTAPVTDIQFAPDESYLITSSKDTTARVGRRRAAPRRASLCVRLTLSARAGGSCLMRTRWN